MLKRLALCACAFAQLCGAPWAKASNTTPPIPCPGDISQYQGRKISNIRLTSPMEFIPAFRSMLDRAGETILLKQGLPFDSRAYSLGTSDVESYMKGSLPGGLTALRLVTVTGRLEDCTADTVDVRYIVVVAVLPRTSGNLQEVASSLIQRPGNGGDTFAKAALTQLIPDINYNHTRGLFGGVSLDQAVPLGIFDRVTASPDISGNSIVGTVNFKGSASPAKEYLNQLNWQLAENYYDAPVEGVSVQKAVLRLAAFGSTKELGSAVTMRFGASVGGGHVQDATHTSVNSSYGEVKLLAGAELRAGQTNSSISYGLEIGNTLSGLSSTFEKHIFDLRYASTFSPLPHYVRSGGQGVDDRPGFIGVVHRPMTIEGQLNAGVFSGSPAIPTVERFLGGNEAREFIPGQIWDVQAQPFIRSISENRFGIDTGTSAIGGTSFYSLNLSLAKVIWGRSLIPRELAQADFLHEFDFGLNSAQGELSDVYYSKSPDVASAAAAIGGVGTELTKLKVQLGDLPAPLLSSPGALLVLASLKSHLTVGNLTQKSIAAGKGSLIPNFVNTQMPALEADLSRLQQVASAFGDAGSAVTIGDCRSSLLDSVETFKEKWDLLDTKAARARADALAKRDFAPAQNVLNALFYRLDIYSVAPVAIFDVAEIWPSSVGHRYALGGGLRLSIVSANFTAGYAANPSRSMYESRGEFFFKINFTDLLH